MLTTFAVKQRYPYRFAASDAVYGSPQAMNVPLSASERQSGRVLSTVDVP
jgi:hypothetical protein